MLAFDARPIYSVVSMERSFILGVIRLEKRLFVSMLSLKAAGHKLPTELFELVEDHLWDHYWTNTTAKRWERLDKIWRERHQGLLWEKFMTKSALDAWSKLADELNLTLAAREGPRDKRYAPGQTWNNHTMVPHVVHLARAGRYSHGGMALRPSVAPPLPPGVRDTAADETNANKDIRRAQIRGGMCYTDFSERGGTFNASYMPRRNGPLLDQTDKVERFIEFEGVEEEMRAWDGAAVRRCVDVLGLEMVVGGEDALRPKLRLVQGFVGGGYS